MFEFTSQQRGQLVLTMFFVVAFLGCFMLAALNLLVPEASVPVATVEDFEMFSLPTIGGLITALASLFVMTRA